MTSVEDHLVWIFDDQVGAMVKVFGRAADGVPVLGHKPSGLAQRDLGKRHGEGLRERLRGPLGERGGHPAREPGLRHRGSRPVGPLPALAHPGGDPGAAADLPFGRCSSAPPPVARPRAAPPSACRSRARWPCSGASRPRTSGSIPTWRWRTAGRTSWSCSTRWTTGWCPRASSSGRSPSPSPTRTRRWWPPPGSRLRTAPRCIRTFSWRSPPARPISSSSAPGPAKEPWRSTPGSRPRPRWSWGARCSPWWPPRSWTRPAGWCRIGPGCSPPWSMVGWRRWSTSSSFRPWAATARSRSGR